MRHSGRRADARHVLPPSLLFRDLEEQVHQRTVDVVIVSSGLVLGDETRPGEQVEILHRRGATDAQILHDVFDAATEVAGGRAGNTSCVDPLWSAHVEEMRFLVHG